MGCDKISGHDQLPPALHRLGQGFFRCRQDLILENLALRQQLLALKVKGSGRRLPTAQVMPGRVVSKNSNVSLRSQL
jgi:hypothetical protein